MPGSQCRPKIRLTPSSAPARIDISAPPGMISSAGWKISRTRPGSSAATDCSARPAPTRPAVCTSCPHACATPSMLLRQGSGMRSSTGSASRSARRPITGPGFSPMSTSTPVLPSGRVTRPASPSRLVTRLVVRSSCQESSGWACRSRRNSSSSAVSSSTHALVVPIRLGVSPGVNGESADTSVKGTCRRPQESRRSASYAASSRSAATEAPSSPESTCRRTSWRIAATPGERRSRSASSSRTSAQVNSSC